MFILSKKARNVYAEVVFSLSQFSTFCSSVLWRNFLTIWKKEREKNIIFNSQSKFNVYFYNIRFNLAPQWQKADPVGSQNAFPS